MIAEQFEYLVSTQNNHFLLEYFRQACGPSSYPCISKFITELKEQAVKPNPSKKKVGEIIKKSNINIIHVIRSKKWEDTTHFQSFIRFFASS